MAKVTITMEDTRDDQGRIGVNVEGVSDAPDDMTSFANIVAVYLREAWDDIVGEARTHAMTALTAELKRRDELGITH